MIKPCAVRSPVRNSSLIGRWRNFAAILPAAFLFDASATVTAFLSNGVTCSGAPIATSTAVTPSFKASLCITSTEPICGMTYAFERVGSGGTPFHLITTKMKPFNTEDWSSFVAGLDSGTCLMTMNLPAPRQWHSWPVILDNDAIGEQSNGPASGEFDLTFREVV